MFAAVQGAIGDMVVKKYGDKFVLTRKPVFVNRKFTPAQKKQQKRFAEAMKFAKAVIKDPDKRKQYEKAAEGKPILAVIVAEYLRMHSS